MDDLILDPDKLDLVAMLIELFCNKQMQAFREFLQKLESISQEWDDERTYGGVLDHIRTIGKNFNDEMEQIRAVYPRQYRNLAVEERNRPK